MLRDALKFLICPHCGGDLTQIDGSVRCGNNHDFDVAREGYVSLLAGDAKPNVGDTMAMVEARDVFLRGGHFAPIVCEVVASSMQAADSPDEGCVVELGAGTAHYLAQVLDRLPSRVGLALDVSKHAVRRAARAHPRIGAVTCDIWRGVPVRTSAATLALNVFAPRNGREIHRILRSDGTLLVVVPTARHFEELVVPLGLLTVDELKGSRLRQQLDPYFASSSVSECEYSMGLRHSEVEALVAMGPSARHLALETIRARINDLVEPITVTASVEVAAYHPL